MSSAGGTLGQKLGEINEFFFVNELNLWRTSPFGTKILDFIKQSLDSSADINAVSARKVPHRRDQLGSPKTDVELCIESNDGEETINVSLKSTQMNGTLAHICRHDVSIYEQVFGLSQIAAKALRKIVGASGFTPEDQLQNGEITRERYDKLKPKRKLHIPGEPLYSFCFQDLTSKEKKQLISELETHKEDILKFAFLGKDGVDAVNFVFITFWDPSVLSQIDVSKIRNVFAFTRESIIEYFTSNPIKASSSGSSISLGELIFKKTRTHGGNPTDLQIQWVYKLKNLENSPYAIKII